MSTPPLRKPSPSDVSDEQWHVVAPSLARVRADAPQRRHDVREGFKGLRWLVRTGAEWRMLPHDFPRWERGLPADAPLARRRRLRGIVHDLRTLLRLEAGRAGQPRALILDSKTLQSPPESGVRAGYEGHKRRQGSKVHAAVDTLGHLLALQVTPADARDRAQVEALAQAVQEATGETVALACVDQSDTGQEPAEAAAAQGLRLEVVKLPEAKHGVVLLPKRWVVERGFAWAARFRRLACDDERLPHVLAGLHFLAFAGLLLHRLIPVLLVHNRL